MESSMEIKFEQDGKQFIVKPNFRQAPEGEVQPMYPGMSNIESTTLTIIESAPEGEKTASITLPRVEVVRAASVMNQNF